MLAPVSVSPFEPGSMPDASSWLSNMALPDAGHGSLVRYQEDTMRILIVEDERKTAAYLRQGLSEHGFVVDVAAQGDDGLHLAQTGPYDLIVLDVMLPARDGWSVLA